MRAGCLGLSLWHANPFCAKRVPGWFGVSDIGAQLKTVYPLVLRPNVRFLHLARAYVNSFVGTAEGIR